MNYDFDQITDRHDTASMKWEKYRETDILPMWVADMDFKAPPPVLEALQQRIDHGVFGYTQIPEALNTVIAKRMKRLYQWEIKTEWITWIPGVVTALNVACRAFGKPDQRVVTTTPVYPPFLSAHKNAGRDLVTVPMVYTDRRASLDFDGIESAFKGGAGLFMLCSPSNPCGTVFLQEEISRIVALCRQYDVVLCSDEIHCDFILDKERKHIPAPSISKEAAEISLVLMAPSKTYNIPGLGCSFAVIPNDDLRKRFKRCSRGIVPSVNTLGIFAAMAAYEKCDPWLDRLIDYLRQNRDLVMERINQMKGCQVDPIEATYLAWIDVRELGIDDPAAFFEKGGVGLSDGRYFGQEGFVRLNFGCPAPLLEKGLERMARQLA